MAFRRRNGIPPPPGHQLRRNDATWNRLMRSMPRSPVPAPLISASGNPRRASTPASRPTQTARGNSGQTSNQQTAQVAAQRTPPRCPQRAEKIQNNRDNRYIIFVHGTSLSGSDASVHWNDIQGHIRRSLSVPPGNTRSPYWGGGNSSSARTSGGSIVAREIRNILNNNTRAEILLLGYSHGGNVAKRALNSIENRFNLSNLTFLGTGVPARIDYQLAVGSRINQHFNFYNSRDSVQIAGTGGSFRPSVSGHPSGRAQPGAVNVAVVRGLPSGIFEENDSDYGFNWFGSPAHGAMVRNRTIWDTYKIWRIRFSKRWM